MATDPDRPADGAGRTKLDELAAFCAGPEPPYLWWQGEPWADAAALLAAFAADPPAGVDVVAFVVTAGLASEADSNAFTDALIDQLGPLAGEALPAPVTSAAGREAYRQALLYGAALRCHGAGRRLVLVVDGLDDDTGPASGLASIASLLPVSAPPNLRVVVTSRPHADLPADLPRDHPLRACPPRTVAATTPAGVRELDRLLTDDHPDQRGILGLVAASGGGLALADLLPLTGLPYRRLERLLTAAAGRTLSVRTVRASSDTPVYVIAPTLHAETIAWLGDGELTGYRDRVHVWADSYRDRGWPAGTPVYLLRTYPVILRDTADTPRLVTLATDPARHGRLRDHTGDDAAALVEIQAAFTLLLRQPDPDLAAMARLCVRRTTLAAAHAHVPTELPAAWATAGHVPRAEALAHSLVNPTLRTSLLVDLMPAVAATGDHLRARTIADAIPCPDAQVRAYATLVRLVAAAGDPDLAATVATAAEAVAATMPDDSSRTWAVITLMSAIAATGHHDRAAALVRMIDDPYDHTLALNDMVSVVPAGDARAAAWAATAEAVARTIDDPNAQASALTRLLSALGGHTGDGHGENGRAAALATTARAVALTIPEATLRVMNLTRLASAIAATGDAGRAANLVTEAELLTRDVARTATRARLLTELVPVAAAIGDARRAAGLATAAEAVTRTIVSTSEQADAWKELVAAVAAAGDLDHATAIADAIPNPLTRVRAVIGLVSAAAATGDTDRALALTAAADRLAHAMPHPGSRVRALTELVPALAAAGDDRRIDAAITTADADARAITRPEARDLALAELVTAVGATGDDRAEAIADTITDPRHRADALTGLAVAVGAAGHADRAAALALAAETASRAVPEQEQRTWGLVTLVAALASVGDAGQAAITAGLANDAALALTDPYLQERVLTQLAAAPHDARDWYWDAMTVPMDGASARRAVAEALSTDRWEAAVYLVAAHTPQTLSAIARALHDEDSAVRQGRAAVNIERR